MCGATEQEADHDQPPDRDRLGAAGKSGRAKAHRRQGRMHRKEEPASPGLVQARGMQDTERNRGDAGHVGC